MYLISSSYIFLSSCSSHRIGWCFVFQPEPPIFPGKKPMAFRLRLSQKHRSMLRLVKQKKSSDEAPNFVVVLFIDFNSRFIDFYYGFHSYYMLLWLFYIIVWFQMVPGICPLIHYRMVTQEPKNLPGSRKWTVIDSSATSTGWSTEAPALVKRPWRGGVVVVQRW